MLNVILGVKLESTRRYNQEGKQISVTKVQAGPCCVTQIKTEEKDGYRALQLSWGEKKINRLNRPLEGHLKGAKLDQAPSYLSEVRVADVSGFKVGDWVRLADVFKPGDKVKITGWSKGKGFTGVVKRWGFKGGPKTHGQSDRQRAPGSIGQGTTPGRVFKGKKMAGRLGGGRTTVAGLVVDLDSEHNFLFLEGLIPGPNKGRLMISKMGESKNFAGLMSRGEKIHASAGKKEKESSQKTAGTKEKDTGQEIKRNGKAEPSPKEGVKANA